MNPDSNKEDSPTQFKDRLKQARLLRNLSQKELSYITNLQSISHFETGSRLPNIKNLIKLSQELRVSTDYLLGLSKDPASISTTHPLLNQIEELNNRDYNLLLEILEILLHKQSTEEGNNRLEDTDPMLHKEQSYNPTQNL